LAGEFIIVVIIITIIIIIAVICNFRTTEDAQALGEINFSIFV